jgi:hypothetical protein
VVSSDPDHTDFRPVRPVDEGVWASLSAGGSIQTPWPNLLLEWEGLLGRFEDREFGSASAALTYLRRWLTRGTDLVVDLHGGQLLGDPPEQAHYLLGGRETVPGYPFRALEGDRYWLFRTEASFDLRPPILRFRAFGAAGDTRGIPVTDPATLPYRREASFLLSAGIGLAVGWDVLRLDLARGLRAGGEWEVILSVNSEFWPWL